MGERKDKTLEVLKVVTELIVKFTPLLCKRIAIPMANGTVSWLATHEAAISCGFTVATLLLTLRKK